MYGGSSKVGRGGGRGGGGGTGGTKRTSFPKPPAQRPPSTGRLGGSSSNHHTRNPSAGGPTTSAPAVEETFSLVPGNKPPSFGMIIRLVPDLVDEIRRAQGDAARIKFDSVNNPSGNVIDVGGKEFTFTWSREVDDLCDIYEERRSGEDGNGLLVESGCAWRKLAVRRVLDESTSSQLKMKSEEAERKQKSRKAIVLDHGNPSMKSQIKQLAAVEANPWRIPFKQKKEAPYKKRKVEPSQVPVVGLSKSSNKSGLASNTAKARRSDSPLSVPLDEQSGVSVSPFGSGNISRSRVGLEDPTPIPTKTKDNTTSSEKEDPAKASNAKETPERKGNLDLQSMLITLLRENPKGMSLKALEKSVGDKIHNAARKIDPIIKKIATYQAPGRYLLKPGMEWETFKKPSSESGSSPEENHQQPAAPVENHDEAPDQRYAPEAGLAEKVPRDDLEEQAQSNSKLQEESNALENIGIERTSPDMHGEKKVSYSSEGQASSSSDSDTDSDSESSVSGTDSGSPSRSRSPARSRSGSSSESDSDASSNSKDGSDEDVDIMLSDDELKHKLRGSDPGFSEITDPWKTNNSRPVQSGMDGHQDADGLDSIDIEGHGSYVAYIDGQGRDVVEIDGHGSDAVNVEGPGSDAVVGEQEFADDEQSVMSKRAHIVPTREVEKIGEGTKSLSPYNHEPLEHHKFIGSLFDDKEETLRDNLKHERSGSSERKSRHKRGPDLKHFDDKAERSKRPKPESFSQMAVSGVSGVQVSESPHIVPPNSLNEAPHHCPTSQISNGPDKERDRNYGLQKGNNQVFPGRHSSDQHVGQKPFDQSVPLKASNAAALPCKTSRETQNEDVLMKGKKVPKNQKGSAGDRNSTPLDSNYGKRDEMVGKRKETVQVSNSQDGSGTGFERYPVSNGRGTQLQRVPSELEAGELREPLLEEEVNKRQFERKGSFKQSESRPSTSDNSNYNLSKSKHAGKIILDTRKPSPPNLTAELNKGLEYHLEEPSRSHEKMVNAQPQHHSRSDNIELEPQFSRFPDSSAKSRQKAAGKLGNGLERYGESYKKVSTSSLQHKSKGGRGPKPTKESTVQKSTAVSDLIDSHKNTIQAEENRNGQKRRGTSFDEDSSYLKYEKDEPELKGPIKDFAQYKEFIQEYRDKYDSYCSLNSILESYRIEFLKMGKDLESERDRDIDRYHKILEQLKESYRECGSRHKRLKQIFIVLHEELKNLKQMIQDYALSYSKIDG